MDIWIDGRGVWWMRRCINGRPKLVYRPINSSTNTYKIIKLCVNVCGCVNANVADSASANNNVAGGVNVYEKIFCIY